MEFDTQNKVIPESLTQRQAEKFDRWLFRELKRHYECIGKATANKWVDQEIGEIFESAVIRHRKDIENIRKLRIKLRELFEL